MKINFNMAALQLVILVLASLPSVCVAVKEKRVKAIEDRLHQYDDYFNAGRFDDIADMWTEDAILIPTNRTVTIGREAIRKYYNDVFAGKGFQLVSVTKTVFGRGSFLSAYGECDINYPDGSLFVHFRFIINFQRIDKEWMIVGNVDNLGPAE